MTRISHPDSPFNHDLDKWIRHSQKLFDIIKMCKNRRTAIDAGANIGLWSRLMAQHFNTVYAYEPIPENAQCFRENTSGLTNIHLDERPLSDRIRDISMTISGAFYGREAAPGEDVHVEKRSTYIDMNKFDFVDLLKVDVDGMDLEVLNGARNTISRCRPVICVETKGPKSVTRPIREFLQERGYELVMRSAPDEVYVYADQQ